MSPRRKTLNKAVDDPLREKTKIPSKEVGETCLPLPPKETPSASTQNNTQKETMKEDEKVVYEDYIFKLIDHYICKPMDRGFEDVIQCQRNFQEIHLRG